jgi:hypothetical protein
LQNYPSDRFSGDFAEIWHLMQIHILFRVGGLHQMPKISESAQKRSTGVLQFPLQLALLCPAWFIDRMSFLPSHAGQGYFFAIQNFGLTLKKNLIFKKAGKI